MVNEAGRVWLEMYETFMEFKTVSGQTTPQIESCIALTGYIASLLENKSITGQPVTKPKKKTYMMAIVYLRTFYTANRQGKHFLALLQFGEKVTWDPKFYPSLPETIA